MVARPPRFNAYEFVVVSALRAQQLRSGSLPRLEGAYNAETMAQLEVAAGRVARCDGSEEPGPRQCGWQR